MGSREPGLTECTGQRGRRNVFTQRARQQMVSADLEDEV